MMSQNEASQEHSAMSRDVRLLGGLLGDIIHEQHGEDAFDLVENVRHIAKERRGENPEAAEQLSALIETLTLEQKLVLVKAFSNYFQLINIAEDQQRIRVLTEREIGDGLRESVASAVATLAKDGKTADEMMQLLKQLKIRLVLTAHPSEAKRKEVLIKLRHITQMMATRENGNLIPRQMRDIEEQLGAEIEELWQTKPIRSRKTTVADEVDFGMYFMTSVIMDTAVNIYDEVQRSLEEHYPDADWSVLPRFLRYASWIGGDRDGNPNVTTDVTLNTLKTLQARVRSVYLDELEYLRDHLTQSIDEIAVSQAVFDMVKVDIRYAEKYPGEYYRQAIEIIRQRLADGHYLYSTELLADLRTVLESLQANNGSRVAKSHLRRLMRKVGIFGLHMNPLEVREDAGLYAQTVDELFRHYGIADNYLELDEAEKQVLLTQEIDSKRPLFPTDMSFLGDTSKQIINTWLMIREAHETYSTSVIDTVIASMSKQPSDVLTMLLFASEVGVADALEIVPLFETIDDLYNASDVMSILFENPAYKAHMEVLNDERGLHQQIMIGYSDSNKDGGYLASNWHLYQAQQRLSDTCIQAGVSLELFHGRGGSIGRGGGPTNRAIKSQPPLSLRGGIKITEQGEVIAYRYSNERIADRHLQQVVSAMLLTLNRTTDHEILPAWQDAMDQLSASGREAYRNFVYETDGFLDYWQQTTPINELSQLQISSRPAKRKKKGGFAAMRAIPWVFSWMQSRAIIPSWFGIGHALAQYKDKSDDGLATLQTMYQDWAFFHAIIDNAQLDVAKADMGIAGLYAELCADEGLRDNIFGRIQAEHAQTYALLCEVTQQETLLETMPAIQTSIERRNPYVDPLNFIQVNLLRELRQMDTADTDYQLTLNAVLATINGIAAGMKTTG